MPRRHDIEKILVLGSGPIVIGQACEFDYSGVQACESLREEGYHVILVNSNPASVATDPEIAHTTYVEAIHWKTIASIVRKERPHALLPTMGGQSALHCALDLSNKGILDESNVEMIGVTPSVIVKAENRRLFCRSMARIGLQVAQHGWATDLSTARRIVERIGYPCIVRPSFTLGGNGSGIAHNSAEFEEICRKGLSMSPVHQLLIDESLFGWKEFEVEVVRDRTDNCVVVCSVENMDPMGIHTGDSIAVTPTQTLSDKECQYMRDASVAVLREIGVDAGGSNVQFSVDPQNGRCVVVEMNPRMSRSSALASKATGFPVARTAAKLSVGFTLDELRNPLHRDCASSVFEPTVDYVVTKIPRFDFEKFDPTDHRLGTRMRAVGEVMAIGRTQTESLQKALRSLEDDSTGFDPQIRPRSVRSTERCVSALQRAGDRRIWYVADAFRLGLSINEVSRLTRIDPWFLSQIRGVVRAEMRLVGGGLRVLDAPCLRELKRQGFGDARIAALLNLDESRIRRLRHRYGIFPTYNKVDACSAEFPARDGGLYSSYETTCERLHSHRSRRSIVVLGSGPNRIGQGVEFDYCCVQALKVLRDEGYQSVMVNCNPATVSTDFDASDRLYFEPVTTEHVLEIVRVERPDGIILQCGGQTPLNLARVLHEHRIPILGTCMDSIRQSEDRRRFQDTVASLGLKQTKGAVVDDRKSATREADRIGYPLIVRPSHVLGGQSMQVVHDPCSLDAYFRKIQKTRRCFPVLLDQFIEDAVEVEVDAVCDAETVFIGGLMEHVEPAGVHSGDSAMVLPPYTLSRAVQSTVRAQTRKVAARLRIRGFVNLQFVVRGDDVYLIEANLRASRTVPFLSKSMGLSLTQAAVRVMLGRSLRSQKLKKESLSSCFFVKESVLPFERFSDVDPLLGPEMLSTGETMGIGRNVHEAFAKARFGAYGANSRKSAVFVAIGRQDKIRAERTIRGLTTHGIVLHLTRCSAQCLGRRVCRASDAAVLPRNRCASFKRYACVIDTTHASDTASVRRGAVDDGVEYHTTVRSSVLAAHARCVDVAEWTMPLQKIHRFSERSQR